MPATTSSAAILVVHPDPTAGRSLADRLRALGHAVCATLTSVPETVDEAADPRPDVALIDLGPDGAGIAAAEELGGRFDVPVVYLVGDVDDDLLRRARATHASGYALEPVADRQLGLIVEAAVAPHRRGSAGGGRVRPPAGALERMVAEVRGGTDLLDVLINDIGEGVVVADGDGRLLLVNRVAQEILGRAAGPDRDLEQWRRGFAVFEVDGRTPLPRSEYPLQRALRGESVDDRALVVRGGNKPGDVHVSCRAWPLLDAEGRLKGGVGTFRDVTRERALRADLDRTLDDRAEQAELMDSVFNSMSEAIAVFDRTGGLLMLNPSGRQMLGIDPRADDGVPPPVEPLDFRHPEDLSPIRPEEQPHARVLRGESFDGVRLRLPQAGGGDLHVRVGGRPLLTRGGAVRGAFCIFRDVTEDEAREAELAALAESARRQKRTMETVFDSISDGVVAVSARAQPFVLNPSARRILGERAAAAAAAAAERSVPDQWSAKYGLFGADKAALVPTDELPLVRALRGETVEGVEMYVRHPEASDGVHLSVSASPLVDDDGVAHGAVAIFRDITEFRDTERRLRRTAAELREKNQLLEAVFDGMSDGVAVADASGRLTMANRRAEEIVGMGVEAVESAEWSETYGVFLRDRMTPMASEELPLALAVAGRSSDDVEMFIRNARRPDGVFISATGRPMRDGSGALTGGVVTFRDVTEGIRTEEAMRDAFAEGRLEVIETVLHNIGNAINSVATAVKTLYDRRRHNEVLHRLTALADEITAHDDDWSRWSTTGPGRNVGKFIVALAQDFAAQNDRSLATAGRAHDRVQHIVDIIRTQESLARGTAERKLVKLRSVITEAAKVLQDSLAKRRIVIEVDCAHAPDEIWVQESRFHQALVNLVKNAMEAVGERYAADPGFEPLVRIVARGEKQFLVIDVIDNGVGIEKEHLKSIFRAGYTTKAMGTGLGLHSAANFVAAAGGRIEPLSRGGGTTMRVRLPMAALQRAPRDSEEA